MQEDKPTIESAFLNLGESCRQTPPGRRKPAKCKRTFAQAINCPLYEIPLDLDANTLPLLRQANRVAPTPSNGLFAHVDEMIARAAYRHGVEVMLSGEGGEEVFGENDNSRRKRKPIRRNRFRREFSMQLGKELRLRWSTADDIEKVALAASQGFAGSDGLPTPRTADIVSRLMRGDCPATSPQDFCLIEDTSFGNHPIVACLCLQHFEWTYEGIPLSIARPEMVMSLPDYRHRGLVRALFAEMHRKTERDDLQAIVGIPYFYHKMGYEYALDLEGKRVASVSSLPEHIDSEPYTLRDATVSDIPSLQQWYNRRRGEYLVWTTMTDQQWRYYIEDTQYSRDKTVRCVKIIVDARGVAPGFLITHPMRWWKTLDVYVLELSEEVNWSNAMPSLLSALRHYGVTMPTEENDTEPLAEIEFVLGRTHPAYEGLGMLAPIWKRPDAWYVRVPDISRLLRHIAPALERHLNNSELAGYNGELKVNLYQGGVRLGFEYGHITSVESWQKDLYTYDADVSMAPHQLWQLILGYRGLDQLQVDADAPDLLVNEKEAILLNTLFPARSSFVFRIEFK